MTTTTVAACPATFDVSVTEIVPCDVTGPHTRHHSHATRQRWTDPCQIVADSGHRAGSVCDKQSRYTVHYPDQSRRVCGRHIGAAIEQASSPSHRVVTVTPDFYEGEE